MTQRDPRQHCPAFLKFLRAQPCCISGCSRGPVEAAHIRIGLTGMQRKPHDFLATPLCVHHHRVGPKSQHASNEGAWWAATGLNPFEIAARLYAAYLAAGGPAGRVRERKPGKAAKPARPPKPHRRAPQARQWPKRPFPKTARRFGQ